MAVNYPWLLPVWHSWQALLEQDRLTGALLLNAPQGLGASEVVTEFSRAVVCANSVEQACGFCHSCDLSLSGNHPDIHWIQPEKAGKAITVDQIRQCNLWAQESSQLGGKRLIIIEPAEAMNESSSNALLKTLESPSESCIFLLVTSNKHQLLPTITSRCQLWSVEHPSELDALDWLSKQSDIGVSKDILRLCHGAPLTALAFYKDKHDKAYQDLSAAIISELKKPVMSLASIWLSIKDAPIVRLGWISYLLVEVQKHHFGLPVSEPVPELARFIHYDLAYKKAGELNRLIEKLTHFTGLNSELLLADWLLDLHGKRNVC
ncbi:DNA polymerase III subunit delta' [Vibrio tapetis]|uniref:DNA polymerase III subunit delta' n=1 Tax=Vibrio tapetis subsp. tapetis TaxID=1671868 RepID=A0A2N8ZB47_9VIBR|nr:DNA polymerase III subunit delta' [Vibrio tapetis]SON49103.1 putative DNA polymerase III subunit delta [Vibrio tapetis subsp. tapetis]